MCAGGYPCGGYPCGGPVHLFGSSRCPVSDRFILLFKMVRTSRGTVVVNKLPLSVWLLFSSEICGPLGVCCTHVFLCSCRPLPPLPSFIPFGLIRTTSFCCVSTVVASRSLNSRVSRSRATICSLLLNASVSCLFKSALKHAMSNCCSTYDGSTYGSVFWLFDSAVTVFCDACA